MEGQQVTNATHCNEKEGSGERSQKPCPGNVYSSAPLFLHRDQDDANSSDPLQTLKFALSLLRKGIQSKVHSKTESKTRKTSMLVLDVRKMESSVLF